MAPEVSRTVNFVQRSRDLDLSFCDLSTTPIRVIKQIQAADFPTTNEVADQIDIQQARISAESLLRLATDSSRKDFISRVLAPIKAASYLIAANQSGKAKYETNKSLGMLSTQEVPTRVTAIAAIYICNLAKDFLEAGSEKDSTQLLCYATNLIGTINQDAIRELFRSRLFKEISEFALSGIKNEAYLAASLAIKLLTLPEMQNLPLTTSSYVIDGANNCCKIAKEIAKTQPDDAIYFLTKIIEDTIGYPNTLVFPERNSSPHLTLAVIYKDQGQLDEAYHLTRNWLDLHEDYDSELPALYRHHLSFFCEICFLLNKTEEAFQRISTSIERIFLANREDQEVSVGQLELLGASLSIDCCRFDQADRLSARALLRPNKNLFQFIDLHRRRAQVAQSYARYDIAIKSYQESITAVEEVSKQEKGHPDMRLMFLITLKSEQALLHIGIEEIDKAKTLVSESNSHFRSLGQVDRTDRIESSFTRWKASGVLALKEGKLEVAQFAFDRALKLAQDLVPTEIAFIKRKTGEIFQAQGKTKEAIEVFLNLEKDLKAANRTLSVEMYRTYFALATIYQEARDLEKAAIWLQKTIFLQNTINSLNSRRVHLNEARD